MCPPKENSILPCFESLQQRVLPQVQLVFGDDLGAAKLTFKAIVLEKDGAFLVPLGAFESRGQSLDRAN